MVGETKRRAFWATWITSCISQDFAGHKQNCWSDVVGLALPSDEDSFIAGRPIAQEAFSADGTICVLTDVTDSRMPPTTSVMAELVKLYGLW